MSHRANIALSIVIACLAAVTLGLAAPYAVQLHNAPLYEGSSENSKSSLASAYGIPPLLTILVAFSQIVRLSIFKKDLASMYNVVMTCAMAVGWLCITIIWGQCHVQAGPNPDFYWTFCWQISIETEYSNSFIQGVNKSLGNVLLVFSTLITTIYWINLPFAIVALRKHKRRVVG